MLIAPGWLLYMYLRYTYIFCDCPLGIVNTEGQDWEELRRFTLRQLRDFGFGRNTMEESIMLEVTELIEWLKEVENKPVENVKEKLTFAVINSVWSICTGERYKHNDAAILEMTERALK